MGRVCKPIQNYQQLGLVEGGGGPSGAAGQARCAGSWSDGGTDGRRFHRMRVRQKIVLT